MRRLITDAQAKFRKMVEDQRQAVVGGQSSSAGPPSSSEAAAEPADSLHSPQPPPTQAGLKAALDAEKGEPPPPQTPPPNVSSASQPPPPPPRERKVPPVPAVTSSFENGEQQEVLVRPPSPAPGPSNKQSEGVAGGAVASSSSSPPPETPCTTSLLTSTSSSSASSSKQQQLSVRLENERLRREVAELRRVLSAQGGVASSVVGGASGQVGGTSAVVGGACGVQVGANSQVGGASALVGGASSLVGGANSQVGGASALVGGACGGQVGGASEADDGLLSDAEKVIVLESQLAQTREALAAAKSDRKRLKAEKFDLLNQMKQLYATLEDKEKELRDFIRSFEQERCERERERWSLLRHARDEAERSLNLAAQLDIKDQQLIEARRQLSSACLSDGGGGGGGGGGDNISLCRASLNGREGGVAPAPHTPTTSSNLMIGGGDRGSCSADSGVRGSSDRESGATSATGGNLSDSTTDGAPTMNYESSSHYHQHQHSSASTNLTNANSTNIDPDTVSLMSSIATAASYQLTTPKDCNSPSLSPLNAHPFSRSLDNSNLSRSVEQLTSPPPTFDHMLDDRSASVIACHVSSHRRSKERLSSRSCGLPRGTGGGSGGGGPWGSISRVFARSRHRSKAPSPSSHDDSLSACGDPTYASIGERGGGGGRSWSPLTEEGYAEKLRLLREAGQVPMERWRAPTVLAWLEIALGMPQYGPRCAENVKSGKVLLELSDVELECGLGITHPMHRKKLRLAIEEHRQPGLVRYPPIAQLGHTWVSSEWLPDLGLAQYSENFAANMVDARMLDNLSKKELEKFLGVTRKFHQASIVHGIHLLRMMKYDRQALAVRRHQCETIDADPLVWTNQRFIRWARNIDLGEYADNLKDSGVHGALVVLEPSLGGDTMATALGIPPSRHMIRRHLTTELEALVLPARSSFERLARERRRADRLVSEGGSLGRSFSRSYGSGLSGSSLVFEGGDAGGGESPPPTPPPHQPSSEMQRQHYQQQLISNGGGSGEKEKDKRRASLRSSLGRVLGLKSSSSTNHHHHHHHSSSSTSSLRVSDPCPLPSNYHFPYSPPPLNFPSNIPPPLPPPNNSSCSPSSPYHPPPLQHPHFPSSPSPTYSSPPQLGGGGGGGCHTLSSSSPTTTLSSSDNVVAPPQPTRQRRPHHRHRRVKSIGDINVTPI